MLPTPENTVAVVPCLNEARTIADVVRGVRRQGAQVVVVDDGSTDDSGALAAAAGARVLRQAEPRGKGAALAAGWRQAALAGAEWVLLLDGDGQHEPTDIPSLLQAATAEVRLVVGNRMLQPELMPWLRRATNHWLSGRLSKLVGVPLPDSQCGFRLAHLPTLLALELRSERFEIESEMVVAFARAGWPIGWVKIQVRYGAERSKISPLRDTLRWWRWYSAARRQSLTLPRSKGLHSELAPVGAGKTSSRHLHEADR